MNLDNEFDNLVENTVLELKKIANKLRTISQTEEDPTKQFLLEDWAVEIDRLIETML